MLSIFPRQFGHALGISTHGPLNLVVRCSWDVVPTASFSRASATRATLICTSGAAFTSLGRQKEQGAPAFQALLFLPDGPVTSVRESGIGDRIPAQSCHNLRFYDALPATSSDPARRARRRMRRRKEREQKQKSSPAAAEFKGEGSGSGRVPLQRRQHVYFEFTKTLSSRSRCRRRRGGSSGSSDTNRGTIVLPERRIGATPAETFLMGINGFERCLRTRFLWLQVLPSNLGCCPWTSRVS